MKKLFNRLAAMLLVVLLVTVTPVSAANFGFDGGSSSDSKDSGSGVQTTDGNGDISTADSSASTTSTYTPVTAPGSFTSSDSSDNSLSVIAYYSSNQSETVSDLTISDTASGVNGVVVSSANVDFDNISITLDTDADGSDTCDFTGKGTAFAVYGSSNVTLSNSTISTTGVATMPIFTDNGATLTVKNSTIEALGGTLYSSYTNTYNQSTMVAPPWVLGIMGTSRASNLMGSNSTLNFLDSTAKAALWAVLSTDSGSDMVMNVYNSTLELTQAVETDKTIQEDGGQITTYDNPYTTNYGSGYGTYVIGDVVENMVGVTMNVGTYAAIFTGGTMSFSTLTAGDYTLNNADNSTTSYSYSGDTRNSVINSDTFGFMAHQNDNVLTLASGTELNTGYTGFLIKTGGSLTSFTADITDADISVGNNVLIQLLDNEDDLIGTSNSGFNTTYTEDAGWNTSSGSSSGDSGDSGESGGPGGSGGSGGSGGPGGRAASTVSTSSDDIVFNFNDMDDLAGNIYNASGYQLDGTGIAVNLDNTTYMGAAASTTAIHVTYDGSVYVKNTLNGYALDADTDDDTLTGYQNTSITISEYYDLGHVANKINSNGSNTITMTLSNSSIWYVTGTSVISSLSVDSNSSIVLVGDATLTIDGTTYSADNLSSAYNMSYVESLPETEDDAECEHIYDAGVVTTAATCTTDGVKTYTCTACGNTYTETIAATGHSYDEGEVTTAATCTKDGVITYTCTACGNTYTETIAATGHSYDEGEVTTAATCTEDGVMTYTCTVCGNTYTEAIEATGHNYVDGVCSVCGEKESEGGDEEEDDGTVTVPSIASVTASESKSIVLTGSWPTTYTADGETYDVTGYGFVYIRTSRLGGKELTVYTTGRVKVILSTSTSYTIVGTRSDTTYTVRAYITYTNSNGKTVYVYSDPIEVSHDTAS